MKGMGSQTQHLIQHHNLFEPCVLCSTLLGLIISYVTYTIPHSLFSDIFLKEFMVTFLPRVGGRSKIWCIRSPDGMVLYRCCRSARIFCFYSLDESFLSIPHVVLLGKFSELFNHIQALHMSTNWKFYVSVLCVKSLH